MSTETEFYSWLERMQIPDKFIPNKNSVKLLLSKNNLLLDDIMTRVRPRHESCKIKDQLKVHHHDRLKENKGQMPPQFKLYNEIKAVNDECEKLEQGFVRMEKMFREKSSTVNEAEMNVIRAQDNVEHVSAKNSLLQMKLQDLKGKLEKERAKQEDILKAFSPGTGNKVSSDDQAIKHQGIEEILIDCHKELDDFYSRSLNETDSEAAQTQIWQSMRQLVDPVPRLALWRTLISSQEKLITDMRKLTDDMVLRQAALKPKNKREAVEASLDYAITFINGKELLSKLNIKKVLKPKVQDLTAGNDEILESFAYVIDDNLATDHMDSNQQQVIEQFVFTIAKHLVLDAELKYVDKVSDDIRVTHTKLQEQIDYQGTKMLTEETHRLYTQLESQVGELENEVTKIYQVKNKLENERKYNEDFVRNKFRSNTTVLGATNVTHNFNPSATAMNQTFQCGTELELFEQLPIEKLKYQSPVFQTFYGTYPYILALNLSPSDVSHLFNCSLTVNELQEHVKKQLKFKKDVDMLKKPLEVGFKAVTVSENDLSANLNQNYEAITELVDKISFLFGVTRESIAKCKELSEFVRQNPLKKFVPASTLFNGRLYSHYDNEFNMYYHLMINSQKDDSRK